MNVGYHEGIRRRAVALGRLVIAVALIEVVDPVSADPQRGQSRSNPLPNQPVGNPKGSNPYSAAFGQGRYTPYPVKDPTAAERAVVAGRAYRTTLDVLVQRATAPPGPGGGPPDEDALFSTELVERLGQWSLRLQEAQDNAAKNLAGRYDALANHLGRMRSLEDGRFLREAAEPGGLMKGRSVDMKPPRLFTEIARFFRPVDERGIDRVIPELVESERPLNPRGVAVTAAERVDIAGRVYWAILSAAVDRFLAPPRG